MTIRARDLPEVRSRLLRYLRHSAPAELAGRILRGDPAEVAAAEARIVRNAELFYVAADLVHVAEAAADALPEFRLTHDDLPAPCGLLVWDRPDTDPQLPSAVIWGPATDPDDPRPGVRLAFWLDAEPIAAWHENADPNADYEPTGKIFPAGPIATAEERAEMRWRRLLHTYDAWLPWTDTPEGWGESWNTEAGRKRAVQLTVATWLLMGQTIITERRERPAPSERRRLARRGDPTGDVRYVALRRLVETDTAETSAGTPSRQRHHRWWTRGHWRNQWYPSEERHRPIWIAPHLRGPEDAPLLHRETVHTLRR